MATLVLVFRINCIGYKSSGKGTGYGQSARMWSNYKDIGKERGCR